MYVVSSAYAVSDPASLSRYTLFITSPQPHPLARHFQGTSLCSQLRAPGTPAPAVIREVPPSAARPRAHCLPPSQPGHWLPAPD